MLKRFAKEQNAAALVDYFILLGMIVVASVLIFPGLRSQLVEWHNSMVGNVKVAISSNPSDELKDEDFTPPGGNNSNNDNPVIQTDSFKTVILNNGIPVGLNFGDKERTIGASIVTNQKIRLNSLSFFIQNTTIPNDLKIGIWDTSQSILIESKQYEEAEKIIFGGTNWRNLKFKFSPVQIDANKKYYIGIYTTNYFIIPGSQLNAESVTNAEGVSFVQIATSTAEKIFAAPNAQVSRVPKFILEYSVVK
ncbi:hypothetical protein [Bacillus toyonensis]|uniref:hypothetical protein n=1 Tax=Bacillus toyonensis TaxID=155322 RepID=UPI002E1FDA9A|nr:hypothetical protein [Bacillus toyonensis]